MEREDWKRAEEGRMTPVRRKDGQEVMRQNRIGDLEYLTFDLLEESGLVEHLVSTRLGGVSEGCLGTMNLSFTRGDETDRVLENYRRIGAVLHTEPEAFVCSDQTHTANIRLVTAADRGKGVVRPKDYRDVDGLITKEKGLVLSTFYADCVPLLFVDPVKEAIGLAHSGWKGTVGEIGRKTIARMGEAFGSRPADILAAIGPSICQDCYEVSEDVAEAFLTLFRREPYRLAEGNTLPEALLYPKENGKYQLNLWEANRQILLGAGILPAHLQVTDLCTCCNPAYLFSHRASGGKRGNLGVFLKLKEGSSGCG